jgi:hypothetical protein
VLYIGHVYVVLADIQRDFRWLICMNIVYTINCLLVWVHPRFYGAIRVDHLFIFLCLLCVFALCVRCCDVRCDFQIIMIFGSSLPPVVCRFVLFMLFVFVCPTHIMLCFCCFTSSRVPNVASFSGLSISDCPFGII